MDIISFNEAATANGRIESFIANPDSTSGIVTVPKVIESGENITIPAGRVAVLPNVQVDGTLNIDGEIFIPSGATFGDLESQIALKANTTDVNIALDLKADKELKTIATGTATFDAVTNSVTFSGLSIKEIENFAQVEIGDVLQYSNATDIKNNSEFTIEVLTQKWANGVVITAGQQRKSFATNITYTALTSGTTSGTDVTNDIGVGWEIATSETIIVNQAHSNKGSSKNVANRVSDTGVTVKLLAKWYNAYIGLGQGWVDMTSSRLVGTTYNNNTNRTISISAFSNFNNVPKQIGLYINGMLISSASITGALIIQCYGDIDKYSNYSVVISGDNLAKYLELR